MKRLYTLIVLLGLLGLFAGCNQGSENGGSTTTPDTNAAPAAPSTNAPAH